MKNTKCIYLLSVICICFLISCTEQITEKKFFDVPDYMEKQIKLIRNNTSTIAKLAVYNGDTSLHKLNVRDVNWEKEFAIFLETDINKPIYYANMTIISDDSNHKTTYLAKSNQLKIQKVQVEYYPNKRSMVKIEINKNNLISVTKIQALYISDSLYTISGEQQIKNLGDRNTFFVKGELN